MTFSSLTFTTLFFPAVLILYFICTDLRWRNGVLLVASLIFYSWGEPIWVLAMIGSTAINYVAAMLIDRASSPGLRKTALVVGAAASLAVLFYFKYAAFLVNSVTSLFGVSFSIPVLELPIGISFYTFQVLTYTVDVYRDKSPVQRDPFKLMLYVSCFPQLIAGPIVQYSDVAVMLDERESTPEGFTEGMKRFAVGLSKKVLLANVCGLIIEELPSAAGASGMSVIGAWYISVLYSLQLYFDFSGYSDMAIGMGRIFGFTYKENFNYPYISKSASEFWRRWHISLGSFFRDYVYIPLGGNRRGRARTALNLAIVWALTGLWHGASWNFVIWGLYYGVLIILEKLVLADFREKLPGAAQHIAALLLIVVGWTVFYYTDMGCLGKHLGAMFGIGAAGLSDPVTMAVIRKYTVLPLIAAIASLPILPRLKAWLGKHEKLEGAADIVSLVCLTALMLLSMIFIVGQSYNPFIYFRF
ncbi:MAG: MBOAT family O-acyltransferase [Oscillospiraceae bacterium]|nr:MBOAT family O-acyltransferase [Oscillospiraceae bacterium]